MAEKQNVEYKSSWHDDYLKWVCGFANAIGGIIYIGIDDNGDVVHLADYARLLEDIPNRIRNAMGIICDVQLHEDEGKKYISIKVNPYTVAVSTLVLAFPAVKRFSAMGAKEFARQQICMVTLVLSVFHIVASARQNSVCLIP